MTADQARTQQDGDSGERVLILTETYRKGDETGAGLMRNRCAFTSRDMAASWADAFTYAVVLGWDPEPDEVGEDDDGIASIAERYGWDAELVAFLRDAHARFAQLDDTTQEPSR